MTRMLQLPGKKLKGTTINMLKALVEKVDNMKKHMGNVSRKMEILKKNQKERITIKMSNRKEECL